MAHKAPDDPGGWRYALAAACAAPRCGARRKNTGQPCQAPAMLNGRCDKHGGKSTGPRTPEGLERCTKAPWKHGQRDQKTRDSVRERGEAVRLIAALKALLLTG